MMFQTVQVRYNLRNIRLIKIDDDSDVDEEEESNGEGIDCVGTSSLSIEA
jgi:hypothetical protein